MKRTRQLDVQSVKLDILRYARDHDLDTEVLIEALAQLCGLTAAVLDRDVCAQPFDERMAAFCERAREAYRRAPGLAGGGGAHSFLLPS